MDYRCPKDEGQAAKGVGKVKFFCDTYALVELIKGNKAYAPYVYAELYTTLYNLYELYYNILDDFGEEIAKRYFYEFQSYTIEIIDTYIFQAASFKLKCKGKNISYVDALGYSIALQERMKFLTGDKEFKDMDSVEFVK